MTNTDNQPGDDRLGVVDVADDGSAIRSPTGVIPASRRETSLAGPVFARCLWFGIVVGAFTGPFVAYIVLLLGSAGSGSAGDWFLGLVVVFFYLLAFAAAGAAVGVVVGVGSAAAVLLALWLESRSVWRVGAVVRVASVAVGGLVGGVIVLPVAAAFFPQGAFAVPGVLASSALISSIVASRQGAALERIRLRSAPFAVRSPSGNDHAVVGRMPRARVFRIWGAVVASLLLLALVELAAALRRVEWYSTCGELGDSYLSRVDFGLWPPQLTCVFVDGSIEVVPRALFVVASAVALLAVGLLVAGVAGAIRSAPREGRLRVVLLVAGSIGMALLALGLAVVTAVGAFGAGATLRPGDPRSAPGYDAPNPYAPDDNDSLGDGSPGQDVPGETSTPAPPIVPIEVPPPSTTYSIEQLTTEMQALVDATFATAGPIVDPAIPPETQTFAVSVGECYVGDEVGQTVRLEVGFDTPDLAGSMHRVRTLWAAEGYGLSEVTRGAGDEVLDPALATYATGADPLPASSLSMRIYDGFLILNVEGLCVSR